MNFNGIISLAAQRIKPGAIIQIARDARPNSDYFFNTVLPERIVTTRRIESNNLLIRSVMAGLVPMDAPYPEGAAIEMSGFSETLVKIAHQQSFNEGAMVALQDILKDILLDQGADAGLKVTIQNFLNFTDKLLVQPHLDTAEYLRAMALRNGKLDWTFGTQRVQVDYGMKAGAYDTNRTGADSYGGTASKFWTDVRAARTFLGNNVKTFVAHGEMLEMILSNPANQLELANEFDGGFEVQRIIQRNGQNEVSKDSRDRVRLVSYNLEAEVLDINTPGKTKIVQFLPPGELLAIGANGANRGFYLTNQVGEGSTVPTNTETEIGFTAIGPVTENDGKAGRWARIYTPENKPASLIGQAVTTLLPVIEKNDAVFRLKSEMQ